jgi:hypothetical protein
MIVKFFCWYQKIPNLNRRVFNRNFTTPFLPIKIYSNLKFYLFQNLQSTQQSMESKSKLAQSAPLLPTQTKMEKEGTYGVQSPVSAATIPSVYNKKISKLFRGRLVVLTGDFTVADALRRMARFNISSVPVTKSRRDNTVSVYQMLLRVY